MFDFFRSKMKLFMGLLFIPLVIGFVLFGVQGYDRFRDGKDAVAKVGGTEISRQELDNAHRREVERRMAAMPSLDRALLDSDAAREATLERLVTERVLALAAQKQHLLTSDQRLVRELSQDPAIASFRTADGKLDLKRYEDALRAQGMTPELYENSLRQDLARRQLLQGVAAISLLPAAAADAALKPWFERREVQVARFTPADFTGKVQVSEADVESFYQANGSLFQSPEQVDIEYVVLDLDAVSRRVTFSESDLRAYYEQNLASQAKKEERRASHILLTVNADASRPTRPRSRTRLRPCWPSCASRPRASPSWPRPTPRTPVPPARVAT